MDPLSGQTDLAGIAPIQTGRSRVLRFVAFSVAALGLVQAQDRADRELEYPAEAFKKLDTFEGLNLEDADKLFKKKDYKGAYAAYKAYSFEFAKSEALPYVLLRMGRCLQLVDKRNAAVKAYQDVFDYFPDDVAHSAAALYYIGECHGQNGDNDKRLAVWAKLVKDDAYVGQPRSGTALAFLGREMAKLGRHDEAVDYHWRTATRFLASNPRAAESARREVIAHYVRRAPNHDKLMAFYTEAGGFDGRGHKVEAPNDDARYWTTVLSSARGTPAEKREEVCNYWTAKMGDRFTDHDALRVEWFNTQRASTADTEAWVANMETQFAVKPASMDRVLAWCEYYRHARVKSATFYARHGQPLVGSLDDAQKMKAMNTLRYPLGLHDEAQAVMRRVKHQALEPSDLIRYALFVGQYEEEETVLRLLAGIKDPLLAAKGRFDYYMGRRDREKVLAEIPILEKSPAYAKDLPWTKAEFLRELGRHEEAIKAYRAANRQPDSTFRVSVCQEALKQYGPAIKTVQGLESLGGPIASRAALRVADIYRASGDKGKEVTQLRLVLRRYPKSSESSTAHDRLESYGVKVTGGEAAADE